MPGIADTCFAFLRRHAEAALAVLLAGGTLLVYSPALDGQFIWNDADYITHPALRTWTGLERIWTEVGVTEQYYPLLHSAFWLQHRLWGDAPFGYHLVNALAHAGCAVLVGLVLRRLAVPGAWIAAALFAVHPVHVETVAWIAEQKNTWSLLLYLGAAWAYLRYDAGGRWGAYALASALFVLALLTKTVTATLPAALLVVAWWRRGQLEWRRDWRPLLPWLAFGAAAGLLSNWIERTLGGAAGAEFAPGWLERLLLAGRAFWFYLGSFVWPLDLNFIYPRWTLDARVLSQWTYPVAAVAVVVGAWALRRRTRGPLAALLFFAGSLAPVLGVANLYGARYAWVWDHWQYLPDFGLCALAGAAIGFGLQRLNAPWWLVGRGAVALLFGVLSVATWRHSRTFHDDETLYRATLRRNPDAWMAHANLGALLGQQRERRAEAITHLRAALRLKPDSADVHESLANLLAQEPADVATAREHYEEAVRLDPADVTAHNNLGLLLYRGGEVEAAERALRRALEIDPWLPSAGANLGALLVATGRAAEAVPRLEQALASEPSLVAAHLALGDAENALGRFNQAEVSYREALRLEPRAIDVRVRLAALLVDRRDLAAAVPVLQEAVALDPRSAVAHHQLGQALGRAGKLGEALRAFGEAVRLRPDWTTARFALANALAQSGDLPAAIREFRAVLVARPGDLRARNNLANALLAVGDLAGAVREYELALEQEPGNASVRANLEFAREQLRRRSRP